MIRRLPAEWEEQDAVLLAWPHEMSDWHPNLDEVEPVFREIARQVSLRQRVMIVARDERRVRNQLAASVARMENVLIYRIDTNDTWTRDFGPITVYDNGLPRLLDFCFNGWGLKFPADLDNLVTRRLHHHGAFGTTPLDTVGLSLEGGSIESDGKGAILTTSECLLSPNRNPHLSRQAIERELSRLLGSKHVLWLEHGFLAGDDTDSHVDTLARLCPGDTIAHVTCDKESDEHYPALAAMVEELQRLSTLDGKPYRLIPLPWPSPRYDEDGQRLPATYANFLVINGAVLVPTYRDEHDRAALTAVGTAFPDREIVGIDCLPLIIQHGSLHCVTMQIPKGALP